MRRSRLRRTARMKAKSSFLLYGVGSIIALLLLGFVGFQLLINYSLLLGKIQSDKTSKDKSVKESSFLSAPEYDIPFSATDSSSLSFAGKTQENSEVELFINDKLVDTTTESNGKFNFRKIRLQDGQNTLKLRAVLGKERSRFSEISDIAFREKEPSLEIINPKNGDSFSGGQSILKISGKTESYAKVTVNGAWSIMDDEGNFRYDYQMQSGENTLNFISKDDANNRTEQEIKFTYSP